MSKPAVFKRSDFNRSGYIKVVSILTIMTMTAIVYIAFKMQYLPVSDMASKIVYLVCYSTSIVLISCAYLSALDHINDPASVAMSLSSSTSLCRCSL